MTLRVIFKNGREVKLPSEVLTSGDLEISLSAIHEIRLAFLSEMTDEMKDKSKLSDILLRKVDDENEVIIINVSGDERFDGKSLNDLVDYDGGHYIIEKTSTGIHLLDLETQWSLIKMIDLVDRGVEGVHFSFNHEHYQYYEMSSDILDKSKFWVNSHQVSLPNESKALMADEEVGQLMAMHFNIYQKCIRHAFSSTEAKEFFKQKIRSGGDETDYTMTKPLLEEMMYVVFGEEFVERRNQALLKEQQKMVPN